MQRVQRRIYFDNASTTNIHPEVLKTYEELLETYFANSESLYDEGSEINRMMEKARGAIAGLLGVHAEDIIFTSGSSESNSAAIKGVCFADLNRRHIVTTAIEHSSILNCCSQLHRLFGYEITYLPVDESGTVSFEDVKKALRDDTAVVSVMAVNNETGAVNPIDEIAAYVKKNSRAYMHVDMTQAAGKVTFNMKNIDLASYSAHKLEGLKGSGILVKKTHVPFEPLINGGQQEAGLRGGTANACINMVFAKTLRLALENGRRSHAYIGELTERLRNGLLKIKGVEINSPSNAVPGIVNFSYESIPSEVMQNALNRQGFMVSARSTCASKENDPSYVLMAMGFSERRAYSCIRVSLSRHNTEEEVDLFLKTVKEITEQYG